MKKSEAAALYAKAMIKESAKYGAEQPTGDILPPGWTEAPPYSPKVESVEGEPYSPPLLSFYPRFLLAP